MNPANPRELCIERRWISSNVGVIQATDTLNLYLG